MNDLDIEDTAQVCQTLISQNPYSFSYLSSQLEANHSGLASKPQNAHPERALVDTRDSNLIAHWL